MKIIILLLITLSISFTKSLNIKSYEADFTQTITTPDNKKIVYSGYMALKLPSYGFWNYKKPLEKKIYMNKKEVVIIESDLEQAIFSHIDNQVSMIDILNNAKKVSKNRYVTNFDSTIYNIFVKNSTIDYIEYEDKLENSVKITFSNIKKNQHISDIVFKYKIPNDYDKIHQ